MTASLLEKLVADADGVHSESVRDWSKRHTDAMVKFAWDSATEVIPANKDKGLHVGTICYPDGSRQNFTV